MTTYRTKLSQANCDFQPRRDGKSALLYIYYRCQDRKTFKVYPGITVPCNIVKKKGKQVIDPKPELSDKDRVTRDRHIKLIHEIADSLAQRSIPVTVELMRKEFAMKREAATADEKLMLLIPYIENLPSTFLTKKQSIRSEVTKRNYKTLLLHINQFQFYVDERQKNNPGSTEFPKTRNIPFQLADVDKMFFDDLNSYMAKKGMVPNSRHTILKQLRALMVHLRKHGFEIGSFLTDSEKQHNDFTQFEYEENMQKSIQLGYHLTEEELHRIWDLRKSPEILNSPEREKWILEIHRTVLNSCLGMRIGDASRNWTKQDLQWNEKKSRYYLHVKATRKTQDNATIPIVGLAEEVLKERNWIWPEKACDQNINLWIKKVARAAGITQMELVYADPNRTERKPKCDLLKSHSWRRSLVNNLTARGIAPDKIIRMTGHKSIKMLETYFNKSGMDAAEVIMDAFNQESHLKVVV